MSTPPDDLDAIRRETAAIRSETAALRRENQELQAQLRILTANSTAHRGLEER